jgi:chromatin modification-related protein EAF6
MAENVPPGSAAKVATSNADRPGLPYYEKLRRDLRDILQKKRILDRNLGVIEDQLYRQETAYLEETSTAGNIVKGFDNYIKASAVSASANSGAGGTISGSAAGGGMGAGRRKAPISDVDRVFSKSSVSYMRDSDTPSSAVSTPNHTGTPTGSFAEKGGDKKKKKAAHNNDDESDSRATKRQKITFGTNRKAHD